MQAETIVSYIRVSTSGRAEPVSVSRPNAMRSVSSPKPRASKLSVSSSRWRQARALTRWTAVPSSRPR
jgi:hypothetical protein